MPNHNLENRLRDILRKTNFEDKLRELKTSLEYQSSGYNNDEIERLRKNNEELRKRIEKAKKDKEATEIRIGQLRKSTGHSNDEIERSIKYSKDIQREIEKTKEATKIYKRKIRRLRQQDEISEWLYSNRRIYSLYRKVGSLEGSIEPIIDYINSQTRKKIRINHVHFNKSRKRGWRAYNENRFRELRLEAECAEKNIAKLKKSKYAQEHFADYIDKIEKVKDELKSKTERLYSQYQEKLKQLS